MNHLREPVDLEKLNACRDSLEVDLNTFQAADENVTDLLMRLELPEMEREKHDGFLDVNNTAFDRECLAEIKVRMKDQEMERVELISQKSLRSRKKNRHRPFNRRQQPPQSERQSKRRKLRRN